MTAAAPSPRILVVEDDPDIAALIVYQLTREGFRVETAATGTDAIGAVNRAIPDLVILDLMLPEMSGDEVLATLRDQPATHATPVLILTAKRHQEDRIKGLELGADDYLTKPFSTRELVLRVQAILRRMRESPQATGDQVLELGPLTLDADGHRASLGGTELGLTPTEFRLLQALLERPGRTQSRRQLLERAWDVEPGISERIQTRTVDMHVRRLRAKLGPVGAWLEAVRGFGYRLQVPSEDA